MTGLLEIAVIIDAAIQILVIAALVALRKRLGILNAAAWLVVWGALVIASEHVLFAISYSVPLITNEGPMTILPHARIHFFMAGIFALVGLVMVSAVARALMREGRRAGWYAVLFALLFGGGFEIIAGAFFYSHGSPLYWAFTGVPPQGFGWEALYTYFVAWGASLSISYKPVFVKRERT